MKNWKKGLLSLGFAVLSVIGNASKSVAKEKEIRPTLSREYGNITCIYEGDRVVGIDPTKPPSDPTHHLARYGIRYYHKCDSSNAAQFTKINYTRGGLRNTLYYSVFNPDYCAWKPLRSDRFFVGSNCREFKSLMVVELFALEKKETEVKVELGGFTDMLYSNTRLSVKLNITEGKRKPTKAAVVIQKPGTRVTDEHYFNPYEVKHIDIPRDMTHHYGYLTISTFVVYDDAKAETLDQQKLMYSKYPSDYTGDYAEIIAPWSLKAQGGNALILADMLTEKLYMCSGNERTMLGFDISHLSFGKRAWACVSLGFKFSKLGETTKIGEIVSNGGDAYEIYEIDKTLREEDILSLISPEEVE